MTTVQDVLDSMPLETKKARNNAILRVLSEIPKSTIFEVKVALDNNKELATIIRSMTLNELTAHMFELKHQGCLNNEHGNNTWHNTKEGFEMLRSEEQIPA